MRGAERALVRIARDEQGDLVLEPSAERFQHLCWLLRAAQVEPPDLLDLLDRLETARAGGSLDGHELDWGGEGVEGRITADAVVVTLWHPGPGRRRNEDARTAYPLDEAHAVLVEYWRAVVSVPDRQARVLDRWELVSDRPHPCRPHLSPGVDATP